MKPNHNNGVSIEQLQMLLPTIAQLTEDESIWDTLDVDYYEPRVERLFTKFGCFRIFLHVFQKPKEASGACLYHKPRWAAAFKILKGSYETGIAYCEDEISSEQAHQLPDLSRTILTAGSYTEMTQTDTLHYVRPLSPITYTIMLTCDLYPEAEFRKEALNVELKKLPARVKSKYLLEFRELLKKG